MNNNQIKLTDRCSKCGVSLRRQVLFAMMIDAGAKTLDPALCPKGGEHDFIPEKNYKKLLDKPTE